MYYVILTHKQQGCRSWRGHERTLTGRLQQRAQLWNDKEVCKSYLNVLFVLYFDNASLFKVGSAGNPKQHTVKQEWCINTSRSIT